MFKFSNRLVLLSCFILISSSFCELTHYKITEIDANKVYEEKTIGNVMNIYSTDFDSKFSINSDLVVDAQLHSKVGIFDSPLIFVSTVS